MSTDPAWLHAARLHMGLKEIPGPRHNTTIQRWLRDLHAWWSDDETPWCGTFVAHCMQVAGVATPSAFYRAKAWASFGQELKFDRLAPGAILVFDRQGGGHVGFYVGENDKSFYVLGGNQSNGVNIVPILKERCIAARWPRNSAILGHPVRMTGGKVSTNEA